MNSSQIRCLSDSARTMATPAPANKILIALPLDAQVSKALLLWAIGLVARPMDSVVAVHILVGKMSKRRHTRLRRAKAFVISMLGDFAEICQLKQVHLEARVGCGSSIGKGLIEEAKSIGADFLLVGGSRNQLQRGSLEVMKYCFKHAPDGCSVVSIGRRGKTHQDSDSDSRSITSEGSQVSRSSLGSSGLNKDIHVSKSRRPLWKLFRFKEKRVNYSNKIMYQENHHSLKKTSWGKASPTSVLDGPEEGLQGTEDSFSMGDSSLSESPPLSTRSRDHQCRRHSYIWRCLSKIKLLFPFFRSSLDGTERELDRLSDKEKKPSWRCFSYGEISNATNNFHPDNMVGKGGFAEVYRGDLSDGRTIAVKRLAKDRRNEEKEEEFLSELGIIGHVSHPNTAYLIGCCIENGLHLIFNFSPNGTLDEALHGSTSKSLEWTVRYKIAIGVARGLHYLHKGCKRRIIHRDIKASNVLLGPDFEPQIADFGLAKWLPTQWTHHSVVPIEGTFGYLAPEYFMHGIVDEKTDVYALGVLLLEIITGRRPVDSSRQSLLLWAKPLMESGDIAELADPKLEGKYDINQMDRLVLTASYCVSRSSIWRPSMTEVLQILINGHSSEVARRWTMPCYAVDDKDDYSEDIDCWSHSSEIYLDELSI
ncbi:probable receptor-like serine/threonine-protein kinase At5g57670 isoform X2 [Macadamia integrifolia]|uniref:probable receptor-like serine/threonine-protein kinase At5g57670 isoform X2 n=1 Tax=Macadamia integrifolia TaxID=60698 RepID=UPI001C4F8088|nr:probable receptor-like serine/threonine-protein kinase At5g57670 isoform X2 [Macadamia integrifolia]